MKKTLLGKKNDKEFKENENLNLTRIFDAETEGKEILLTNDLLFKNDSYVVSPIIFCKKVSINFLETVSPNLIIFESLLKVVCQSYYRSENSIEQLIDEVEEKSK